MGAARACLLLTLSLASCSLRDLDYLQSGDASSPDDAAVDSAALDAVPGDTSACPAAKGPPMIRVDSFCIDATEVTERDYAEFLDAKKGDTSGQIAECAGNTSYAPDPVFFPKKPTLPVRGIDWCDAYAYCAWAGKRLCGKIGGGAVSQLSADDPEVDQWFRACSRAGTRDFPYGNTYDPTACLTDGSGAVEVKSMSKCQGGYDGIFDMSGNVWEFEDACDDSGCAMRGGAWNQDGVAAGCAFGVVHYRNSRDEIHADNGFRCCSQ